MQILKKPHITEKSALLNKKNKYCFVVDKRANKVEIKKAINKLYTVNVEDINTMRCAGKPVSRNTKKGVIRGKRAPYKKAIVTLATGDTIDIHTDAT